MGIRLVLHLPHIFGSTTGLACFPYSCCEICDSRKGWSSHQLSESPGRHRDAANSNLGFLLLTSRLQDYPYLQEGSHEVLIVDKLTGPPSLTSHCHYWCYTLHWVSCLQTAAVKFPSTISSPAYRAQWYHPHCPSPDLQDRLHLGSDVTMVTYWTQWMCIYPVHIVCCLQKYLTEMQHLKKTYSLRAVKAGPLVLC